MARTGPLLFAKIDSNDAYLLGVGTHANFTTQALVQLLVDNFPAAMARYELPGILNVWGTLTDDEIANAEIGMTVRVRQRTARSISALAAAA